MIALVAAAVSAVGWLSYRSLEQALLPRVLDRIETNSRLVATDLESHVRSARGDIATFRGLAAVTGLMRAHLNGGIDPTDGTTEALWRERLGGRLAAQMPLRPAHSLRFIGVEDNNREILRVDQPGPFHNVVDLAFNPVAQPTDSEYGILYITAGDGGNRTGYDRTESAQDLGTIFGNVLRIDPNPAGRALVRMSAHSGQPAYSIPADNPYATDGKPITVTRVIPLACARPLDMTAMTPVGIVVGFLLGGYLVYLRVVRVLHDDGEVQNGKGSGVAEGDCR